MKDLRLDNISDSDVSVQLLSLLEKGCSVSIRPRLITNDIVITVIKRDLSGYVIREADRIIFYEKLERSINRHLPILEALKEIDRELHG